MPGKSLVSSLQSHAASLTPPVSSLGFQEKTYFGYASAVRHRPNSSPGFEQTTRAAGQVPPVIKIHLKIKMTIQFGQDDHCAGPAGNPPVINGRQK